MALYDAFVSYSHAKDKPVAAALQSVIQRLGKPWYRRRALRLFRDDTSLSATPGLWPSIERALANSRFLILLASPEAAASPWVNKEVAYWLDHKSADTLLIAVTEGALAWDNTLGDFKWHDGMPLAPVLTGRFVNEPKWVDLRAYRDGADTRDARFIEAGAEFAAAVSGMPKEDLLSQEVRQQRRALTLAWLAVVTLLVLTSAAGWLWRESERQRAEAVAQTKKAEQNYGLALDNAARAIKTLETATNAANTMVLDLAQKLGNRVGMPIDIVRDVLEQARALQNELMQSDGVTPALLQSEYVALEVLARTLSTLQQHDLALPAAERSREIAEQLLSAEPFNKGLLRTRAISYQTLGRVLADLKSFPKAQEIIDKAIEYFEELERVYPDDAQLQQDLANTYSSLGDLLIHLGKYHDALENYRLSLAIIERGSPPEAGGLRSVLYLAYFKVGDALARLKRDEDALAVLQKALSEIHRLVARDDMNASYRRHLAATYQRIGTVLEQLQRHNEALKHYQQELQATQSLAVLDAANPTVQDDLYNAYTNVGNSLGENGRAAEAVDAYKQSFAIAEKFAMANPDNVPWRLKMTWALMRLASVQRDDQIALLTRALDILRPLDAAGVLAPEDRRWVDLVERRLAFVRGGAR